MLVLGLLGLASATQSEAYEIRPRLGLHEAMTLAASECLLVSPQAPWSCHLYSSRLEKLAAGKPAYAYGGLERAVRWPDDPTRQIGVSSLFKFAFNASFYCPRHLRNNPEIGNAGLLCSSHFGRLQFWHAMVSETGETRSETLRKMLAWSRFTFEVATGRISPDTDYCQYFGENNSAIASKMKPENFPFCITEDNEQGWQISTLFSMKCSHPIWSGRCTAVTGLVADSLSRSAATGALLHVIQDSYSQSHAARGPGNGATFEPRIECLFPTRFYDYRLQTTHVHRAADKVPVFAPSCLRGGEVDDAITASAMALWHVRQRSDPDELVAYLERRVFGRD
jgi:hypothetical protein